MVLFAIFTNVMIKAFIKTAIVQILESKSSRNAILIYSAIIKKSNLILINLISCLNDQSIQF